MTIIVDAIRSRAFTLAAHQFRHVFRNRSSRMTQFRPACLEELIEAFFFCQVDWFSQPWRDRRASVHPRTCRGRKTRAVYCQRRLRRSARPIIRYAASSAACLFWIIANRASGWSLSGISAYSAKVFRWVRWLLRSRQPPRACSETSALLVLRNSASLEYNSTGAVSGSFHRASNRNLRTSHNAMIRPFPLLWLSHTSAH